MKPQYCIAVESYGTLELMHRAQAILEKTAAYFLSRASVWDGASCTDAIPNDPQSR